MKRQQGFTLIELIAVIVILGILAATAVPRFVNLQDAARLSAAQGIAGGISSASAMNYAAALAVTAGVSNETFQDTSGGCTDGILATLMNPSVTGYSVSGPTTYGADPELGDSIQCTLTDANDSSTPPASATFTLHYAEP